MNYDGKFDATISSDGQDGASHFYNHVESVHGHAPADAIIIPDAQFLFHADFKRSGLDLILHKDDRDLVLHDYFKGDKHAALASPDGAHLTGDLVNALAGSVDVAQAGDAAAGGHVIGHVTKLVGSATAIRNGVSIILNVGDNVEKGDVVQSGSDSTLGITFIDGTVFGLSSNARMVLNEMVYDPNGSNNSSLLSLVAGTITFVAGETAKHGDMKVDTPVATMGIRGTAVLVEIDFTVPGQGDTPDAKFQVLVEPDGHTGSYILFDKTTLQPLAMVNQAGQQINISNGIISQSSAPLSPDVEKLIQDVFTLKFSANDTNPKTTTAQTDTINPLLYGPLLKLADNTTAQPIYQQTALTGDFSSPSQIPFVPTPPLLRVPGPPTFNVFNSLGQNSTSFALTELPGKTGPTDTATDVVTGSVRFVDPNAGDLPTVSITLDQINFNGAEVNGHFQLVSGTLSNLQLQDLADTGITISVVPASTNNNNGSASWTYSIADNKFDFLAAGETLVLTYVVKVDNNFAGGDEAATQNITITIIGTNDAPVITTSAQVINFSGGTSTPGGPLNAVADGKLNFTDVDLDDTHKASAKLTGWTMSDGSKVPPGLVGDDDLFAKAMTASIETDSTGSGSGVIDWTFAALPAYAADFIPKGVTLALTYTITVTDSQGATDEQTVTVDITGTGNAAVVWIHTDGDGSPNNLWSTARNWETNAAPSANDDVIIVTDQLIGLTPSYPVTIDESTLAFAHSLTMNDYSDVAPELDVYGSLTISAQLSLSADSILKNFGTISIGGKAEFLDHSVLVNAGQLTLQGGGDFAGSSSITNDEGGTIEIAASTTPLNVSVNITNYGQITVDVGALLALDGATIDGGTVSVTGIPVIKEFASVETTINDGGGQGGVQILGDGLLELQGFGVLQNGTLDNTGEVDVTGAGNALHNEKVTADHGLEVKAGGALLVDQGTTIANDLPGWTQIDQNGKATPGGGSITVDDTASLTVNDATIAGGMVTNEAGGTIALTGAATLENGLFGNSGQMNVSGAGNVLDGEMVSNTGAGGIDISGELTLQDASSITNGDGNKVTVESDASLTLSGTSYISGGELINFGTVNVEGSTGATFDGVNVNNTYGTIQVDCDFTPPVTLLLDHGAAIGGGTLAIGDVGTLEIASKGGATLSDVAVDNSNLIKVDYGSQLTLDHSTVSGGGLDNCGTVNIEAATTFDGVSVNNTYGTIQVDCDFAPPVTLLLDDGTTIRGGTLAIGKVGELEVATEAGATLSGVIVENSHLVEVDEGAVLALAGSSILNGAVVNYGTIDSTSASAIDGAAITNDGVIAAISGTMTIDPGLLINIATLQADGGELDITGELLNNKGTLAAIDGGTLKLTSTTVTGCGLVAVGACSVLDLDNSGISAATLNNSGTLDNIAGDNTITAAVVDNGGTIEVQAGTLDLAGGISGTGTLIIDAGATLEIAGADGQTITYSGGTGTLELDLSTLQFTGTIIGQSFTGGNFTITGAANIESKSGDAIDFIASGGTHDSSAAITLTPSGTITGAANGIKVVQNGVGAITVDPTGDVTGLAGSGIIVEDSATGRGKIVVDATGSVTGDGPGGLGLLVQNLNASNGGGIDVTATGGASGDAYGIDIDQNGDGNVKLDAGGTITSNTQYGIRVRDFGTGDISVTTDSASVIKSGSSGIVAVNRDTAISTDAASTITVNAHGTIDSGSTPNISGAAPSGINAGYAGIGGAGTEANLDVNGDVIVNNDADITAAAGAGIDAYNFGNGDVTVRDKAGTSVVGATYGIIAEVESGGTGDVSVHVAKDATLTGAARYGILAYSVDAGTISVKTSSGDHITSGSSGIVAVNEAISIAEAVDSTITVIAKGTINSGAGLNNDGTTPAGIIAGYLPGGEERPDDKVAGNVTVKSDAEITAAAGYGILAYTYGTGDVTVLAQHASSISVMGDDGIGIGAFAHDGGDVAVTNKGTIVAATGVSSFADACGNVDITNAGQITGSIGDGIDVFDSGRGAIGAVTIVNDSTGTISGAATSIVVHGNAEGLVTIDNAGTIGGEAVSSSTSAIYEDGGYVYIDNTGDISGNINVGDGIFTNESTGIWQVGGTSSFGADCAGIIQNFGTIDLSGNAVLSGPNGLTIIDSGTIASVSGDNTIENASLKITSTGVLEVVGGELTIDSHSTVKNFGTIDVAAAGSTLRVLGSDTGTGEVVIDKGAVAEFGSYVSSDQTIDFSNPTGRLVIDKPSLFDGHIAGISGSGDVLDLGGFNAAHDVVEAWAGRYDAATNTTILTVTDETTEKSVKLSLTGDYADTAWTATSDGNGGTDVSLSHQAPVIDTDNFKLTQNSDGSITITDLQVTDSDPSDTFSLVASTDSKSSSVSPSHDKGSLADIDTALDSITYNPTAHGPAPQTDQVNVTVTDCFGASETVHFIFNEGGGCNVTLRGESGHNVLLATGQSDTLIGGGQDQFVFKPTTGPDPVQHTVIGFNSNIDTIDVRQFGITSWSDVTATQEGKDTLLTLDNHDSILLKNVLAANLHASDFIVAPHSSV